MKKDQNPPIIFLMGPTASGKTPLAIELVQHLPCDIISVDSAMVYKGMDIGSAKPDAATLKLAPHRLIDLLDPAQAYSAGQFRQDALKEIQAITAQGRIPLLVGGTMLYFKVLQQGIADLPPADLNIRAELDARAAKLGWTHLHQELSIVDPISAARIHANDSQRIQRALEVYLQSGKTLSALQQQAHPILSDYQVHSFALSPLDRSHLHQRIALRFKQMLAQGFIEEVQGFYQRSDLNLNLPSMRSVGYRQVWEYLAGEYGLEEMQDKAIAATRQLAKRQLTWLRAWQDVQWLDSEDKQLIANLKNSLLI